jgi:hypothetical protein
MKVSMKLLVVGVALMSAIFSGCNKEHNHPDPNTDGLILIGTAYTDAGSMLVKLYSADSIYSQYTKLYIEVRDSASNEVVDDAHVELSPMMDMGMMMHAAPFENPSSTDAVDGLFPCAVVFIMPGDMGWTLDVHVHNHHSGAEGEANFPLVVKTPTPTRTVTVTPLNGDEPLVISYVQPTDPTVGINDFEITLHYRETMMAFPARTNYTVSIEPEMPSMGHGSPNNVNPTHVADGHYTGQVNFTMTGLWRINLNIMDGTEVVDSTSYFEVTLP